MNYPPKRKIRKKEGKKNKTALQEENETFLKHFRMTTHQVKKKDGSKCLPHTKDNSAWQSTRLSPFTKNNSPISQHHFNYFKYFSTFHRVHQKFNTYYQPSRISSKLYISTYICLSIYTHTNTNAYNIRYSILRKIKSSHGQQLYDNVHPIVH